MNNQKNHYREMANERMLLGGALIDALNSYNPARKEDNMTLLYMVIKKAMEERTEIALDAVDNVLSSFKEELEGYREFRSSIKQDKKLRTKLSELEQLPLYSKL